MIDLLEAQKRITDTVAGREDYVYPRAGKGNGQCVYFESDGTPSCLIGHALEAELRSIGTATSVANELGIEAQQFEGLLTLDAMRYLASAQEAQDSGKPWGRALAQANQTYRILVADW
jgi:hypothetical protein